MATLRQDTSFPGVDGATWPAAYVPSGSTGFNDRIVGNGLGMTTGTVGARTDTARGILDDTNVNGVADLGARIQFDFSNETPLQDEQLAIFLRAANDWTNGASPSTWVRTTLHTGGQITLEHRLASGTNVNITDATTTVTSPIVAGSSTFGALEVQGNVLRAKWWPNTIPEPFTGGPNNDGWLAAATMSTDIVTAGGRFSFRLLGANAAGVAAYARIRNVLIYDLAAVSGGGGGSSSGFVRPVPRARHRRRR